MIRLGRHAWATGLGALLLASVQSAAIPAAAAEPTAELAAGGIVFAGAPDLVTDKEDVVLGANLVRITYSVRNAGEAARSTLFAFALPNIDMLALDGAAIDNPAFDPKNPANYVAVAVLVDGQPAETYAEQRALALGLIDQTARLIQYELPLYPFTAGLSRTLTALPDAAREDLAAHGLVRLNDGQWEPLWRLKTTLFWQQRIANRADPYHRRYLPTNHRGSGLDPGIGSAAAALLRTATAGCRHNQTRRHVRFAAPAYVDVSRRRWRQWPWLGGHVSGRTGGRERNASRVLLLPGAGHRRHRFMGDRAAGLHPRR